MKMNAAEEILKELAKLKEAPQPLPGTLMIETDPEEWNSAPSEGPAEVNIDNATGHVLPIVGGGGRLELPPNDTGHVRIINASKLARIDSTGLIRLGDFLVRIPFGKFISEPGNAAPPLTVNPDGTFA